MTALFKVGQWVTVVSQGDELDGMTCGVLAVRGCAESGYSYHIGDDNALLSNFPEEYLTLCKFLPQIEEEDWLTPPSHHLYEEQLKRWSEG